MKKAVYTLELTRADHAFTDITVHKSGHGVTVFGGDAMWQWGFCGEHNDPELEHVRSHGKAICWAEWLHNGLLGMHATILHAEGGPFAIHDRHADYEFMNKMWDLAQLPNAEVLEMGEDVLRVQAA